jgi:hypothetical protein
MPKPSSTYNSYEIIGSDWSPTPVLRGTDHYSIKWLSPYSETLIFKLALGSAADVKNTKSEGCPLPIELSGTTLSSVLIPI